MELENLNNPIVLVGAIPVVLVALNSFLKKIGMPEKFCPLVNIIGGFVAVVPLMQMGLYLLPAIIGGLMVGLSAGGFYDFSKVFKQ